jgi:hypothetical protein
MRRRDGRIDRYDKEILGKDSNLYPGFFFASGGGRRAAGGYEMPGHYSFAGCAVA